MNLDAKFVPFVRSQDFLFAHICEYLCNSCRTNPATESRGVSERVTNWGGQDLGYRLLCSMIAVQPVLAGSLKATWVGDVHHPGGAWSKRVRIVERDARYIVVNIENYNYY